MINTLINKSKNDLFYATTQSVGFDISSNENVLLFPFEVKAIKTGLFFNINKVLNKLTFPELSLSLDEKYFIYSSDLLIKDIKLKNEIYYSYELQIRPRSSSLLKNKLSVELSTIDPDYDGEIHVIVQNVSILPKKIKKGQRIAQGVLSKIIKDSSISCKNIKRNSNGLGSTGK